MKKTIPILLLIGFLVSCARLPELRPLTLGDNHLSFYDLSAIFPEGRWQLSHAIEATVPGGGKNGLVGVLVLSSKNRKIQCALMTIEGFVLFSGRYEGEIVVERALPPFDRPGFAEGLMTDLQLLFFQPEGELIASGTKANGELTCRYRLQSGQTTDIIFRDDYSWAIHRYAKDHRIERSVEAQDPVLFDNSPPVFLSRNMSLQRHGAMGYRLDMRLVKAIPLDQLKLKASD